MIEFIGSFMGGVLGTASSSIIDKVIPDSITRHRRLSSEFKQNLNILYSSTKKLHNDIRRHKGIIDTNSKPIDEENYYLNLTYTFFKFCFIRKDIENKLQEHFITLPRKYNKFENLNIFINGITSSGYFTIKNSYLEILISNTSIEKILCFFKDKNGNSNLIDLYDFELLMESDQKFQREVTKFKETLKKIEFGSINYDRVICLIIGLRVLNRNIEMNKLRKKIVENKTKDGTVKFYQDLRTVMSESNYSVFINKLNKLKESNIDISVSGQI